MHHNPSTKRQQMALRFFTYGVMTVAVIIISIICILFVLGYRFDQTSGRVEQRSLLQLRSFPSNAAIILDGKQLSFQAPGKRTVAAGDHTVAMRLDGYREWSKQVTIQPGSLLWLNYARLIPQSITTEEIRDLGKLSDFEASPNRRWVAITSMVANKPQLAIGDISNETQPKFSTVALPRNLLKLKGTGKLTLDEWDFSGRYILARYTVGAKTEFLQIDRSDPSAARNITSQLKLPITKAHFSGTSGTTLFVLSDGDIRKIDLAAGTISRPLVANVKDFMLYKSDTIAYAAIEEGTQQAGIYKDGDKEPRVVRTFKGTTPRIKTTVSSYFNDDYFAIAHDKKVEIIKDPLKTSETAGRAFASFTFPSGAKQFDFSSNGRFVLAQNGTTFASYDLEEDHATHTTMGGKGQMPQQLQWLDDYYLAATVGHSLRFSEFDGTNQQEITSAEPGYESTLSENGEQLFSIGKNDEGQFVLQRSRMVLKN